MSVKRLFTVYLIGMALLLTVAAAKAPSFRRLVFSLSPMATFPQGITGAFDPAETRAVYYNQPVNLPPDIAQDKQSEPAVLGQTAGAKKIYVDLTNQRLYAFEGNRLVYNFLISSGKWGRTPTGTFNIWVKLRYTKMEGGSTALGTYYYLPNVPYVMYFANNEIPRWRGFGLHGTYWHNNFGHPMSHGCVNLKTEDAGLLYYWSMPALQEKQSTWAAEDNPGTEIIIYGEAPWE